MTLSTVDGGRVLVRLACHGGAWTLAASPVAEMVMVPQSSWEMSSTRVTRIPASWGHVPWGRLYGWASSSPRASAGRGAGACSTTIGPADICLHPGDVDCRLGWCFVTLNSFGGTWTMDRTCPIHGTWDLHCNFDTINL